MNPKTIVVPAWFYDLFLSLVDPWRIAMDRAAKQLGRHSSQYRTPFDNVPFRRTIGVSALKNDAQDQTDSSP